MKYKISAVVSFFIVPVLIGTAVFFAVRFARAQAPDQWVPMTLRIQETSNNQNGAIVIERLTFAAVRADGSRASGDSSAVDDKRHFGVRSVLSTSEGTTTVVNDLQRSKTTTFLEPAAVQSKRRPPADATCLHPRVVSGANYVVKGQADAFFGLRTVLIQYDNDDVLTSQWESPDLNCLILKQIDEFRDKNGVVFSRLERVPIGVERGEPDAQLFAIPTDYIEVLPSEMRLATARQKNAAVSDKAKAHHQALDKAYLSNLRNAAKSGRELPKDVLDVLRRSDQ